MMDTNHSSIGQRPPIDRMGVIKQLVSQQFFLPPDFVIDRTHRIEIRVKGSDQVFKSFSEYLYEISKSVKGENATLYYSILKDAAKNLNLSRSNVEKRFHEKSIGFLKEGLATEEILFITAIATILESLDLIHYELFLEDLWSHYNSTDHLEDPSKKEKKYENGIKRLGEIADSYFSILLNLRKIDELAKIFGIKVTYNHQEVENFYKEVINSIKNFNS
ncbi:MAG: hypothetical protein ACFFAU_13630 [Candidatus Hodarchaeota archaeon]